MTHIFISYSRKDLTYAEKLTSALEKNSLKIWIDKKSIPKGEELTKEIYGGIEKAAAFLFLVSPDSMQSNWCNKEFAYAVKNGKRIIPIVIRDTDLSSDNKTSNRNCIFCRAEQDDFVQGIKEIVDTIYTDYEWVKYHTELQVKAVRWKQSHEEISLLMRGKELKVAEEKLGIPRRGKDLKPTVLQQEFVSASRKHETKRQRLLLTGLFTGLTVALALFVIAVLAFIFGRNQQLIAEKEAVAKATAQSAAQSQGEIASGRELASQAQLLPLYGNSMIVSGLLSIEAANLDSSIQVQQSLSRVANSIGNPIERYSLENTILSGAISLDGKFIAAGDAKGNLNIWDAKTDQIIANYQHKGSVLSIAFSPIENKVLSIGNDLVVWDLTTGKVLLQLDEPTSIFQSALFSADGNTIIALSELDNDQNTLIAIDLLSGNIISRFVFDGTAPKLSLSQQNSWAVIAQNYDNEKLRLQVWDWRREQKVAEKDFDVTYNVYGYQIDNSKILSVDSDVTVVMWDVYTGNNILSGEVCKSAIRTMILSTNAEKVAIGCDEGTIKVLDTQNLNELMSVSQDENTDDLTFNPVFAMGFNADASRLITGGSDGTAIVWDIETQTELARMPHEGSIQQVAFNPVENWVISWGRETMITAWIPANGLSTLPIVQEHAIQALSFDPEGNLLVASYGGNIQKWDISRQQMLLGNNVSMLTLMPVVFSRDGSLMISDTDDNIVRVFNVTSGKEISSVAHIDWVDSISIDDNNKYIISGSPAAGYLQWDPSNGSVLNTIDLSTFPPILSPDGLMLGYSIYGENQSVQDLIISDFRNGSVLRSIVDGNNPIVFSPGNSMVAFTNHDFQTLRVWNISENQEYFSATHAGKITLMSFSPDGKFIVTTGTDSVVHVWQIEDGNEVANLIAPSKVNALTFSPDNRFIVYSYDNIVYTWYWRINDLKEMLCLRLPRNLTSSEWIEYFGTGTPYRTTCQNLPTEVQ